MSARARSARSSSGFFVLVTAAGAAWVWPHGAMRFAPLLRSVFVPWLAAALVVAGGALVALTAFRDASARRERGQVWRLRKMDGGSFEDHVVHTLRALSYRVEWTGKGGADQGVDVVAERDGRRIAVQAKQYSGTVGNAAIQQVFAGMTHYGCDGAVVVCTSGFTKAARELSASTNVTLVDGEGYAALVREAFGNGDTLRWRIPALKSLFVPLACVAAGVLLAIAHTGRW